MTQGIEIYSSGDDSDESDEPYDRNSKVMRVKLADWCIKHKVMYSAIDDLLILLRNDGYDLPLRATTLIGQYARQSSDELTRIECLETLQGDKLEHIKMI